MPIKVDTWLYGELAKYGGEPGQASYANLQVVLDDGSTISDLLDKLSMPTELRGITFINGNLSALPGIQPDLNHELMNGDRVGFFHLKSMWPYQYRSGAAAIAELSTALSARPDRGVSHSSVSE